MSKLNQIQNLLDCLKSLSESAQQEIKDKLMICNTTDWDRLADTDLENEGIVDTFNDDHSWYRSDDLSNYGYIHEDDIMDHVSLQDIDDTLAKDSKYVLHIDTIEKLYKNEALSDDEKELIKAMLDDEGIDHE